MTRRTSSATRRKEVSRSSVVFTTSATSSSRGSIRVICSVCVATASTLSMITVDFLSPEDVSAKEPQSQLNGNFGWKSGGSRIRNAQLLLTCDDVLRRPQQRALDVGIGEVTDRLAGRVRILVRPRICRLNRSVPPQHLEDFAERDGLKSS